MKVLYISRGGVWVRKVRPFLIEPARSPRPVCPALQAATGQALTLDWQFGRREITPIYGPMFAAPTLF